MSDNYLAARDIAFKYLYLNLNSGAEVQFDHGGFDQFMESYEVPDSEHPKVEITAAITTQAITLIEGVIAGKERYQSAIESKLKVPNINHVKKVDLAVLLIGTHEIFNSDKKAAALLNESIDLAKRYGTEESFSFINGVLDKIYKEK
jgi:N utilization substance protein B